MEDWEEELGGMEANLDRVGSEEQSAGSSYSHGDYCGW